MHDYEKYLNEKGFIEDYRKLMPGNEVRSLTELTNTLEEIFNDKDKYLNKYSAVQGDLINKYYDIQNKTPLKILAILLICFFLGI